MALGQHKTMEYEHQSLKLVNAPRQKRYAPKVRSGCITCKIRRKKCDETKPKCNRCLLGGYQCDGYVVVKPLMFTTGSDADEQWSFHYFRDRTTHLVVSFASYHLWDKMVVQAGYTHDAIRCAMTAIGAFNEAVDHSDPLVRHARHLFATKQYKKAIQYTISDADSTPIEVTILAAILFGFLENISGHIDNSIAHLNGGIRILEQWKASHASRNSSPQSLSPDPVDQLSNILSDIHLSIDSLLPPPVSALTKPDFPTSFTSLTEAHDILQGIVDHATLLLKQESLEDRLPTVLTTKATLQHWFQLLSRFLLFKQEASCGCTPCTDGNHHELGALFLQMLYWTISIRLSVSSRKSETEFDDYLLEFQTIMRLANQFCTLPVCNDKTLSACLGFEVQSLAILQFVATDCREHALRWQAIELMDARDRIEGIWHSTVCSEISRFVVQEEERLAKKITSKSPIIHSSDVPDRARLHLIGTSFFSRDEAQRLQFTYETLNPDCVKVRLLSSPADPSSDCLHTFWLDRRNSIAAHHTEIEKYPKDVTGIFPQSIESTSNLWQYVETADLARFVRDASYTCLCMTVKRNAILDTKANLYSEPASPSSSNPYASPLPQKRSSTPEQKVCDMLTSNA